MSDPHNSVSALNHLPPDLFEAILPLLPPKSLGRFKSVSKRWYSLISSPQFIKTHICNYTKNNPNPKPTHLILVRDNGDSVYSVDIKQLNTQTIPATLTAKRLNFQKPCVPISGSCNGLVLANDRHHNLVVNPTTGKTLKVPDGTYGFGYNSSTDNYKAISISFMGVSDKLLRSHSLHNNSWNMLPNSPYILRDLYSRYPGVLINNNLHWLVRNRRLTPTIAAFNLASEEFHEIEFPDSVSYLLAMWSNLCVLDGKLVVVARCAEFEYELWMMEEYGVPKSWTKLCIINNDIHIDYVFYAQVSNRDILLGNNSANEIVIYNMDERRCRSVTVKGCPKGFMVSGTYVETLESLERFL